MGVVLVAHLFSFLCCFVGLHSVFIAPWCVCPWIVHSWLPSSVLSNIYVINKILIHEIFISQTCMTLKFLPIYTSWKLPTMQYDDDGWKKLQFAYFDYFPVYYFVQVHSICLSPLFKTHSLVDYACTWLRLFQKRIGYTNSKKSLKIPKGQSESVYRRRTDNTMGKKSTKGQTTIYKTCI